jgi:hypothetical protein
MEIDALIDAALQSTSDDRAQAMDAAMTALIGAYPGAYWDTPYGRRLRPMWEDYSDALTAEVDILLAEQERRIRTCDWPDDPWSQGDPFA